jgi:hypothetical protein
MKMNYKKVYTGVIIILIVAFFGYFGYFFKHQLLMDELSSIPTTSSVAETYLPILPILPIYLQDDPRWKDDKMGNSEQTLGEAGCFVSGISMALAHYGIDLNPKQLNELLNINQGYTQRGWVKWNVVTKIADEQIHFYVPSHPSFAEIDAALKKQQPVLAKIRLYGLFYHWVLIVGKDGQEYLVKDPLGDGKSLDKLSQFKSKVYAIRVIKKK